MYMQERVLDSCGVDGSCAPLTVIDCSKPSFRSPDTALRKGGIDVVALHYPWSNKGTTVFVGVPRAIRGVFALSRPFFAKELYDRFRFVENTKQLVSNNYVSANMLPRSLGGSSRWSLRTFVPRRCLADGALCKPPPNDLS